MWPRIAIDCVTQSIYSLMFNKYPGYHNINLNISSFKWCSLINGNGCISLDIALISNRQTYSQESVMRNGIFQWMATSPNGLIGQTAASRVLRATRHVIGHVSSRYSAVGTVPASLVN